jgi:hypothetical protein
MDIAQRNRTLKTPTKKMVIKIVCYSSIPKYPLDVPVLSTQKYPENSHVGSGGGGRLASVKTRKTSPKCGLICKFSKYEKVIYTYIYILYRLFHTRKRPLMWGR